MNFLKKRKLSIIMIGPPGVGKGTQSSLLSAEYNIPSLSSGDVLREVISSNLPEYNFIRESIADGKLVSDNAIIDIMIEKIKQCNQGFILDGFPRNMNQALIIDSFLDNIKIDFKIIINIFLETDLLLKRISGRFSCKNCGAIYNKYLLPTKINGVCDICNGEEFITRKDDIEDIIYKRIDVYNQETSPIIEYYSKNSNFISINGNVGSKQEIYNLIHKKIRNILKL
ncbi:adenylate kinase family protein [Lyticum sinuosum]|uniref:Adenylate kinase n=1 Tax=Lyticum sinuosum TaxID=1332059 RepID=A0AAE4VLB9_9RICK|nr:nucleoside monophosphate kinase [Lyticum sinuosum]MDZ5761549.1 adenylate kinase [Lyticum sinuosum]